MQKSFHYFGTYCAAYLAGYSHEESLHVCYSAQLVDWCSETLLKKIGGPLAAATTQLPSEMARARNSPIGRSKITRIWASFHFLPRDLHANPGKGNARYQQKYRMICGPNGDLLVDTVNLARGKGLQAAGLAMHVLADTWAHQYFAGTPSLVINNTNRFFVELLPDPSGSGDMIERPVKFRHNPTAPDDLENGGYTNSVFQAGENNVMNLGHGRAGHLPDYGFMRYRYLPAWADYEEVEKDNPSDFYHAFAQMVYALKFLREGDGSFETNRYDFDAVADLEPTIKGILEKRQPEADVCEAWRALGQQLSGCEIPLFDLEAYQDQYKNAGPEQKSDTVLGRFILAALAQKGMVVNRVSASGNPLAGRSVGIGKIGLSGMKDFQLLEGYLEEGVLDE